MPRQNRVTPYGEIVAVSARGTLMGNRGCLHDSAGTIKRPYRLTAWIYCLLEFKGRRRHVMTPGKYTELFFLDEATALSAGHRPCAECQRARFNEFMRCWSAANAKMAVGEKLCVGAVDAVLQSERFGPGGKKLMHRTKLAELPAGCVVELDGKPGQPWVVAANGKKVELRQWQAHGYGKQIEARADLEVGVLTPASVVRAIAAGFVPVAAETQLRRDPRSEYFSARPAR